MENMAILWERSDDFLVSSYICGTNHLQIELPTAFLLQYIHNTVIQSCNAA